MDGEEKIKYHIDHAIELIDGMLDYRVRLFLPLLRRVFADYDIKRNEDLEELFKIYETLKCGEGGDANYLIKGSKNYSLSNSRKAVPWSGQCFILEQFPNLKNDYIQLLKLTKKVISDNNSSGSDRVITDDKVEPSSNHSSSEAEDDFVYTWNEAGDEEKKEKKEGFLKSLIGFLLRKRDYGNDVVIELNCSFYYHICKSLLNAEYIIDDRYSSKLSKLYGKIENLPSKEDGYLYLVKSAAILSRCLDELCKRLQNITKVYSNKRLPVGHNFGESIMMDCVEYSIKSTEPFHNFAESLIQITAIDHIFKYEEKNIEELSLMWSRIKTLSKRIEELSNFAGKEDSVGILIPIVEVKTAILATQMLGKSNAVFYTNSGSEFKKEVSDYCNSCFPKDFNPIYSYLKETFKDREFNKEAFPSPIVFDRNVDIQKYDGWINKGNGAYVKVSSVIESIEQRFEEKEIVKRIKDLMAEPDCCTPWYYVRSLRYLLKEGKSDDCFGLAVPLLSKLGRYIRDNERKAVSRYMPTFAYSFYEWKENKVNVKDITKDIVDNYDLEKLKNSFFMVSYGLEPLNFQSLKDEFERLSAEMREKVILSSAEIETTKTEIEKTKKEQDRIKAEFENESNDNRRHTIQLFGIFSAFIAFISSVLGTYKVVGNIWEFILYCLAYSVGIVTFVMLIFRFLKDKGEDKDKKKNSFFWGYLILVVITVAFAVFYYTTEYKRGDESGDLEKVSVQITNTNGGINTNK